MNDLIVQILFILGIILGNTLFNFVWPTIKERFIVGLLAAFIYIILSLILGMFKLS